jgi:outer membrane protein assembly factor BamD
MKRSLSCVLLIGAVVAGFPLRSPAPLVYRPGEGWTYEPVGSVGKWQRTRAKDQLDVAQEAFDKKDYSLAKKAAAHLVRNWPLSDYAPRGQYLLGRCYEEERQDEKAFDAYQKLLEKYPKLENYQEILSRQFAICNRFLAGEWFKLWGYIPYGPSMDRTVGMYEKVVKNGPYSDLAPQAQMNIGAAHEKETDFLRDTIPYLEAAKAYELAADRYHYLPKVAADAMFKEGLAYDKQARRAEYDQGTAGQAIDTFTYFMKSYPDDPRVKDGEKIIAALKTEQARGNFEIARFYEKGRHWEAARIYYNESLQLDPYSPYAAMSLQRISELNKRLGKPAQ